MKESTSKNYRQRLTRVIDYIHDNIDGNLDVNTLADIAYMSPYHFHRIYRELMHETVNATVRRLRLQKAAVYLIRSDKSSSTIAQQVSYGSVEAFTHAFTKQFGMSPSNYRKLKKNSDISDEPYIAMLPTEKKRYDTMYDVETITIDKINLAGFNHIGDYMDIGNTFEKLFMTAGSMNLLRDNTRSIGIYYDDPKTVNTNELRSMACVSVENQQTIDNQFEKISIPAGKCVSVLFKGPYAELEKPYDWLFGHWVPENNKEIADFPPFEEYLNNPKTTPPNELLTRIYCLLAD